MFLFCFETPFLLEIYAEVHKGKMIHLGFAFKNPIRKKKMLCREYGDQKNGKILVSVESG